MVLDVKSSQEYPVNARDPQGTILGRGLFLLYISDLPGDVIWDIALYVDDSTLYSNCNQAADLWQQLELTSELEPDLWDTVYWGRKWLVDFNAGKTQPFLFDQSNTLVRLMWKCNGSVLEEILGLTFSSKLDWVSYIISIAKTISRNIGTLIRSIKSFSPKLALYPYQSTIRPCLEYCCHA